MSTVELPPELVDLEERVTEHLAEEPGLDAALAPPEETEDWEQEPPLPPLRVGLVVGCSTVAAAVMAGGLFEGIDGRVYPALAGLCGVAIAAQASRRRSALAANLTIVFGIVATGIVLMLPAGVENLGRLVDVVSEAKGASKVMRPPAEFLPGWRLVVGWIMASIGFAAGWVGIELRRPALGLLVPLPAIAFAAISVPEAAKLPSGIAAAVLFILGLVLLSSMQNLTEAGEQSPGLGYELRRLVRSLPILVVIVGLLAVAGQSDLLFPKPRFDPVHDAQSPKAVPLSAVEDRVLFRVTSSVTGPWRIGMLDVYEQDEWRLPAFAESRLARVPDSGVVDPDLETGVQADFEVRDLGGAVLPGLLNTTGIIARGPRLSYDPRTGTIRLAQGQIRAGLSYTVVAAGLPSEEALRAAAGEPPEEVRRSLAIPPPPPEIAALLAEPPGDNAWDRLEFLRRRLLETMTAAGPGTPKPVPPSRVVDLLFGSKEGSPYEAVAAQAMLARWAGVPARIGYGFDGGVDLGSGVREIRPRHGASWLEVWFPGFKWLPLIGSPLKAKAQLNSDEPSNPDAMVEPSDDIAVHVYFPLRAERGGLLYRQVQRIVLLAVALLALLAAAYWTWPIAWKAWRRSRARTRAEHDGPRAQVAQAYAEFRDLCTDLGLGHWSDSPLAFLSVLVDDDEHAELAWLVSRVVWGDLRDDVQPEHALDAAELSRVLRKRLLQVQPASLRAIAAVSRLSVRRPYAPELARTTPREQAADVEAA